MQRSRQRTTTGWTVAEIEGELDGGWEVRIEQGDAGGMHVGMQGGLEG